MNQLITLEYTLRRGHILEIIYTNGIIKETNVLGHIIETEQAFTEQLILN